jgi:hypothetical protein
MQFGLATTFSIMWYHVDVVVAQWLSALADTRLPSSSSGFNPGFPHSLLRGSRSHDCVIQNKISGFEASLPE